MRKLFIFGATGDLVRRKVMPALKDFKDLEIIALGRRNLSEEKIKEIKSNLKNSKYSQIKFSDDSIDCLNCINELDKRKTNYFYVSLPPKNILPTLNFFGTLKKQDYKVQALIEKPFGNSLKEAKMLQKRIKKLDLEKNIFLSDHYLFKENFLNIKSQNKHLKKIKIVSLETLGIEGRKYYDEVGAIKDMVQGHFFNMLFKVLPEKNLKNLKLKHLKTSQYKEYQKELNKTSKTETYAKIILKNRSVEIELETGKRSKFKESYIKLNDQKISLIDKSNPYEKIMKDFLQGKRENFPTIKNSIKAWKITEKILKKI